MENIQVVFDDVHGTVEITGHGFSGPVCEKTLAAICDKLGITVEEKKTAEFYQTTKSAVKNLAQNKG